MILLLLLLWPFNQFARYSSIEIAVFAGLERSLSDDKLHRVGMALSQMLSLDMPHSQSHKILELDYIKR